MNPREQACAAVRDAQERRDTRAEHAETQRAKALTHEILKEPPGKGVCEKQYGFPWPGPKMHQDGHANAVNAELRSVTRIHPDTGEQVISFNLEGGQTIWLRLDKSSMYDLNCDILHFRMLADMQAKTDERIKRLSQNVEQAGASTAPAAARAGNLFSRTFARIWGRS